MEDLQLTETEKRYFSDLFVCCDVENTGKVPQNKAFELFRSGNITADTLEQITDILQFKANVLNRLEFYSYLKLIAAHQANLPLNEEVLTLGAELPLPRFKWPEDDTTDSEVPIGSPSSTASDSPTPTNSVQERSWAVGNWAGLCEEQRQLLGTEEESSDRHSSEEDTEVASEVWTITPEQRDYYANQFKQLQPDLNGLLAGGVARKFFEKSMLPVAELRKIWQLSDVTKDGMLNLDEFNTAMHLVVLRRNHISLPLVLPAQLNPAPFVAPQPQQPRPPSPQIKETWTKFIDSPTSSPGPKPVNFDFQKASVEKDPKILHPKPLRLTPEISQIEEAAPVAEIKQIQRPQPKKNFPNNRGAIPPPPQPQNAPTEETGTAPKKDKPPPPPPRPIRAHGRSSSLDLNRLGKNGFLGAPPLIPPLIPPRISPNISTPPQNTQKKLINQRSEGDNDAFADFDRFDATEKYENICDQVDSSTEPHIRRHGAFEVYRKPVVSRKESPVLPAEDTAKYELYKKLKEQNLVLLRLCQELSQELADVREERTTLRLRLEQQQSAS